MHLLAASFGKSKLQIALECVRSIFKFDRFDRSGKLHVTDHADVSSAGGRLGIGNVSCVELLAWPGNSHGGWPKS